MNRPISQLSRIELIQNLKTRYHEAGRVEKGAVLTEFTKLTGYHRKHAIRLLKVELKEAVTKERGVSIIYNAAVKRALIVLWEASDRLCGKRLRAAIPELLSSLIRHGHFKVDSIVEQKLLGVSCATIDRMLKPIREKSKARRIKPKSKATGLKQKVRIKTFGEWKNVVPGYFEADFVVHCGGLMSGSVIHSFSLTDVYSGWTEVVPLVARDKNLVIEALKLLRKQMPFPLLGINTDNDTSFINEALIEFCQAENIEQTRARPYKKNDQAWIEQKNGSVVRKFIGYGRYQGLHTTRIMAKLYDASRMYTNYFQPSFKLKSKVRVGTKVKKTYYNPIAPYKRLLEHPSLSDDYKTMISKQQKLLDPFALIKTIRECQSQLAKISGLSGGDNTKDMNQFITQLSQQWEQGENRPTHRQEPSKPRHWRTRKDPFEDAWPEAAQWLSKHPDETAKALLTHLMRSNPGQFKEGQLRTLQRSVSKWHEQQVKALFVQSENVGFIEEWVHAA